MKKIYCFDLDGTVTSQELLPLMAAELDLYDEISALTQATINGLIPFERSFKLRCKLLSDVPIKKVQEVAEKVKLNESIVQFMKENKDNSYIVTGNIYEWIQPIIEKIGCKIFCSKGKFTNDKLSGLEKILDKGEVVKELRGSDKSIISVGDGMGDVLMFQESDLSIAYGGVHEPIETLRKVSNYIVYEENSLCRLLNTL
ncbi:HAD-IB family phosphatase [Candidatus Pelagibacter sp.]|nr:HAD-IB family phosphatase [Candidatus Pelagibacter sp.]|tara:strand:+ start:2414 stop:3013 length:600 start_codon:yes stop_codon:yes gene_type:complete